MTENEATRAGWIIRFATVIVILGAGIGGMYGLKSLKKKPAGQQVIEKVALVKTEAPTPKSYTVELTGYGRIKPENIITIAPQVTGRIIWINPRLKPGITFTEKDTLFKIDPEEYTKRKDSNSAKKQVLTKEISSLQEEVKNLQELKSKREKLVELAKKELKRQQKLDKEDAGTDTLIDAAQRSLLQAEEALTSTKLTIKKLQDAQEISKARMKEIEKMLLLDELNIERCVVKSPGNLRITAENLEEKQLVISGQTLITMCDDNNLVLDASVNGREAVKWLQHDDNTNWYESPKKVQCEVYWTQENSKISSAAVSHILDYNKDTSMVIIRLKIKKSGPKVFSGLFCKAVIPGKTVDNAIKVPIFAITDSSYVFIEKDGLLDRVKIEIIFRDGNSVIVKGDFPKNCKIITSKVPSPVLGMKVKESSDD